MPTPSAFFFSITERQKARGSKYTYVCFMNHANKSSVFGSKIYNDQTSCSERRAAAESRSNSFLVATPQESFRRPDDMSIKEKEELISYVAILPFKTSKPRYFYIALTNCPTTCKTQACDSPLSKVRYIFQGGNFHGDRDLLSEFSYGDRWFLPLYMMTFILSTFMSAYAVYVSYSLSAANKFHVTVCASPLP